MTAKAHIIDDDEAIRDALAWLLESRQIACASYASAEQFLTTPLNEHVGCLVLDIRMQGMSGLSLFDNLRERHYPLPVIFLTGHGDVPMAVAALKKGAYDFFEKPFNDNDLVNRIVEAITLDVRRQAREATRDSLQNRLATLTPRERQTMELVLAGKYNKIIADELQISVRTVEVHRANLFDKMGVKTAVELARLLGRSQ
jgi:two-component system, LuxR family, response regulator DctR